MIKRLQRKFVLIVAVCLLVVEVLIIGGINIFNIRSINAEQDNILQTITENDGKFPDFFRHDDKLKPDRREQTDIPPKLKNNFNEETRYQTRFFTVSFDSSGEVSVVNTGQIAAVDSEKAVEYANEVINSGKTVGNIDCYRYRVAEKSDGKLVVFLDVRSGNNNKSRFMLISVLVAAAGYVITCLLVIVFSKRAVRPAIESFEKQRRFITDAGHEIKTPLAIISANTEVIEMTSEPSEWTSSIRNQVTRLDGLVRELLDLSKMEEGDVKLVFTEFDLSAAVREIAGSFEPLAKTNRETLEIEVHDGITINGDERAIRKLTSILVENAVKYADDDTQINVKLDRTSSARHVELSVSNVCQQPPKDTDKLFDRFYRDDASRSRDGEKVGGYGIGLSIARAVTEAHKGRISCAVSGDLVTFTARFRTSRLKEKKQTQI